MSSKSTTKRKTTSEIIDEKFNELFMPEDELIERGMDALSNELGVVEAGRFVSILVNTKPGDSVHESRERYKNQSVESIMKSIPAASRVSKTRARSAKTAK